MKKIVLAAMLASGLMAADSGLFIGVEYGKASSTDTWTNSSGPVYTYKNDYSDMMLKIGAGADGETKVQLRISKIDFNEGVFVTNESNNLTELGFDIIKEFEVSKNVYPFIKVGLGYGWMNTNYVVDGSSNELSFDGGVGMSYKAVDHVYLIAGVDYVYRKWTELTNSSHTNTLAVTASAVKPYIGVNYKF